MASIFVAAMFYELTNRFDFSCIIKQGVLVFGDSNSSAGPVRASVLICTSVPRTLKMFYELYVRDGDGYVQEVARFLNTQTDAIRFFNRNIR